MSMLMRKLCFAGAFLVVVNAHDDHHADQSATPDSEAVSAEALGTVMWLHIFTQIIAYGIIFPIGMVFGVSPPLQIMTMAYKVRDKITKARWHVPIQLFGTLLAIAGFFLGHAHTGRKFVSNNIHATFAWILQLLLVIQVGIGFYVRSQRRENTNYRVRKGLSLAHSLLGKAMPIVSWTQMLFGGITSLGFCQGDALGQCLAHFILGSGLLAYGILLTIVLLVGQLWIRSRSRSQEFYDSVIIAMVGCVNTFTEHKWGTAWVRNDWQHTTIGVIWWAAGMVGIWLSWGRAGGPKRNFVPGAVLFVTGWTMGAHPQELMVSAAVHKAFGFALMAGGVARIVEIAFVLRDQHSTDESGREWNSFQFIPIFCLYAAGFLLMGATEEQMRLIDASSMDHVSYILALLSVACVVFLFVNVLIHLYDRFANARPEDQQYRGIKNDGLAIEDDVDTSKEFSESEDAGLKDDLELHGLLSDDETFAERTQESLDFSSSSTVGKQHATYV